MPLNFPCIVRTLGIRYEFAAVTNNRLSTIDVNQG